MFRWLLIGSRWTSLPPTGRELLLIGTQVKFKVMLRPTVNSPICLGVRHSSVSHDQISTSITVSYGFVDAQRPLWRQDGSVVYAWCWASPAQSFSDPSHAGLITVIYGLKFWGWRVRPPYLYPPGRGCQSYTPGTPLTHSRSISTDRNRRQQLSLYSRHWRHRKHNL
jgi:hypothetical protein